MPFRPETSALLAAKGLGIRRGVLGEPSPELDAERCRVVVVAEVHQRGKVVDGRVERERRDSARRASCTRSSPRVRPASRARRRKRCARHSHVMPIPPHIWIAVSQTLRADSAQYAFATRAAESALSTSSASTAHAACHITEREDSTRTSASAQRCCTAWNEPTGVPNCTRVFAYSVTSSSEAAIAPTRSPASTARA